MSNTQITVPEGHEVFHFFDKSGDVWMGHGATPETALFHWSWADVPNQHPGAPLDKIVAFRPVDYAHIGFGPMAFRNHQKTPDFILPQEAPMTERNEIDPFLPREYDFAKGDRRFFLRDEALRFMMEMNDSTGKGYQFRTLEKAILDRDDLYLVQAHDTLVANPDFKPWGIQPERTSARTNGQFTVGDTIQADDIGDLPELAVLVTSKGTTIQKCRSSHYVVLRPFATGHGSSIRVGHDQAFSMVKGSNRIGDIVEIVWLPEDDQA